jgi:23S rRNA pseudouridine2605 synthase
MQSGEFGTSLPIGPVRLQKLISSAGFGSRRGAEEVLRAGRVTVNGKAATLGDSADPQRDRIAVEGEPLEREKAAYWMLHKPAGVVTTVRDPERRRTVLDLLPKDLRHLYPVGRLDYDSTGLVLMTNDGALTHALLHPSLGSEREYRVIVRGALTDKARAALEHGVVLEEGRTAPGRVEHVTVAPDGSTTAFHLTLVEGRNRQIRRSLLALRHPVKKLCRVRTGPLQLGALRSGAARPLLPEEIRALNAHARELGTQRRLRPGRRAGPRTGSGPGGKGDAAS